MEHQTNNELEKNYMSLKTENIEDRELDRQNEVFEFPSKPQITENKQSLQKSIFSIVIFAVVFYIIFGGDITSLLMLIAIILIHELGHFVAMKIFKYKDLSIYFIPLVGAFASGDKEEVSQKQQIIISLAGPVPGLFFGSILIYYGWINEYNLFLTSGSIFLFLNLFNLLPLLPMDGGRIIQALFFHQKETITIVLLWISIGIFVIIGIYTENWFILLICFLIFMQINSRNQHVKVKKILKEKGFNTDKNFSDLTDEEYWKIREIMASNMRGIGNLTSPNNYSKVASENTIIKVMKSIVQKPPVKSLSLVGKILFFLTWLFSFTIPMMIILSLMIWKGTT